MDLKTLLRQALNLLRLDLTKNLEYDRLTMLVMKKVIKKDSNCIDVGCHKGEILDLMLKLAPRGKHHAFEPLPDYYSALTGKYSEKASIHPWALSNTNGSTSFQYVKNAPAFSGIKRRSYLVKEADIEEIQVDMKRLDDVIPEDLVIDFIKIDVEGGELGVLQGAEKLLKRNQPTVIFEFGKGAADHYQTQPQDILEAFGKSGHSLFTLKGFTKGLSALSAQEFATLYREEKEYYFIGSVSR